VVFAVFSGLLKVNCQFHEIMLPSWIIILLRFWLLRLPLSLFNARLVSSKSSKCGFPYWLLSRFPPLHYGAVLSTPAFSTPCIFNAPAFPLLRFQSPGWYMLHFPRRPVKGLGKAGTYRPRASWSGGLAHTVYNKILYGYILRHFGPRVGPGYPLSCLFPLPIYFLIFCFFYFFPFPVWAIPFFFFCPSLSFLPWL